MKCTQGLILSILTVLIIGHICLVLSEVSDEDEPNGSSKTLSWTTNHSIVSDKIRTYDKEFSLTPEEELALDRLRPLVKDDALLPFHRRDNFLIKFLRAQSLNVEAAAEMYKSAMKWRRTRDLDKMLNEDYSRWERLYPFIISGTDRQKGPVFYILAAAYDLRKAVIAGHYTALERLYDRSFELAMRYGVSIYETTGENVALTGTLIIDLAGFNLRQHACPRCLPLFAYAVNNYETYWPQILGKLILINVPRSFEIILDIIRPAMSPHTARALEVYGLDRTEWEPALKKYVDPDQLLVRYGGNRTLTSFSTKTFGG